MGIKLLSSNCGAHLVESYCKESNFSDTNWLRYPFSSYLIKTRLSIRRHHFTNLHIWNTWTSLEPKEIFEKSKKQFSSHAGGIFVLVALQRWHCKWTGRSAVKVNMDFVHVFFFFFRFVFTRHECFRLVLQFLLLIGGHLCYIIGACVCMCVNSENQGFISYTMTMLGYAATAHHLD